MQINRLLLEHFRLIRYAEVELAPGANLFLGENAQGKTTVLEAVSYLATGRSFRTPRDRDCLPHSKKADEDQGVTAVNAAFEKRAVSHDIRTAITEKGKGFWVDGKPLRKLGELWGLLNVVVFIPADLVLVQGGPSERRALVDSLLARTSRFDLQTMQSYAAALRHRNALLRSGKVRTRELDAYEDQMAEHGSRLLLARQRVIDLLAPAAEDQLHQLTGGSDRFSLRHDSGLPKSAGVAEENLRSTGAGAVREALLKLWHSGREGDTQRGFTQQGPHRGDVVLVLNDKDARTFASQGQSRSIVLALRLAEVELVEKLTNELPVLLLDDVMGELDRQRTRHFVRLLSRSKLQALLTATDAADIEGDLPISRRFVVKGGRVE